MAEEWKDGDEGRGQTLGRMGRMGTDPRLADPRLADPRLVATHEWQEGDRPLTGRPVSKLSVLRLDHHKKEAPDRGF